MTRAEFIAKYHDPEGWKARMVCSIWEDGEVTLEKGGDLFGHRNLHQMIPPHISPWPVSLFPVKNFRQDHGRIYLKADLDYEQVVKEMATIVE